MGAWGEGVFENDQAGDWLDQLVQSGKPAAIDKALTLAIQARPGKLDADDAAAALAAAEVVAASRGHRHAELPDDVKEWLAESDYVPTAAVVALSVKAVGRVRDDSELLELSLAGTKVTGAGLAKLLALKKLDWIGFSRTALTDADVPTLLQFPKGNIFAHGTKITVKGKQQIADSGHTWINV